MKTIYFKNPVAGTTESYISYAVQPINNKRKNINPNKERDCKKKLFV